MTRMLFCLALSGAILGSLPQPAHAQSCPDYLANKFIEAKTNASHCGVSVSQINSIDSPSAKPGICSANARSVQSQLGAFQACGAVYFCAAEAYRCAMKRVSAGASCDNAMRDCIAQNPIPQIQ